MEANEVATASGKDSETSYVKVGMKRQHLSSSSLLDEPQAKAAKGSPLEKNALQKLNELMPNLEYNCIQSGPGHQLIFTVTVEIRDKV